MADDAKVVDTEIMVTSMKTLSGGYLSTSVVFPQQMTGGNTFAVLRVECPHLRHFLGMSVRGRCDNKLRLLLNEMRKAIARASVQWAEPRKLLSGGFKGGFGRRRFRSDNKGHMEKIGNFPPYVDATVEEGGDLGLPETWNFTAAFNARKCDAPTMLFDKEHWEKVFQFACAETPVRGNGAHVRGPNGRTLQDLDKPPAVAKHKMKIRDCTMYRARVYGNQGNAQVRTRRLCAGQSEAPQADENRRRKKNREDVYSKDEFILKKSRKAIVELLENKREMRKKPRSTSELTSSQEGDM